MGIEGAVWHQACMGCTALSTMKRLQRSTFGFISWLWLPRSGRVMGGPVFVWLWRVMGWTTGQSVGALVQFGSVTVWSCSCSYSQELKELTADDSFRSWLLGNPQDELQSMRCGLACEMLPEVSQVACTCKVTCLCGGPKGASLPPPPSPSLKPSNSPSLHPSIHRWRTSWHKIVINMVKYGKI